jgi:hypothetical protein
MLEALSVRHKAWHLRLRLQPQVRIQRLTNDIRPVLSISKPRREFCLMSLVDFDFMMLRCSPNNRQRLAKIYKDVQSTKGAAERRLLLLDLLTACSFDPTRGVYVPFSETVYLLGKLQKPPVKIEPLTAPINQDFPYTYFTNPLLLPLGYDAPDFEIEQAPAPKDRLTTPVFIVITFWRVTA